MTTDRNPTTPAANDASVSAPSAAPAHHVRTRVKICGLTREADVDAAVDAGADAVGFVLYPKSLRYVTATRAAELARRLPPFVTPVLLFVDANATEIIATEAHIPWALLQFHGEESPRHCLAATHEGARPFIRAARVPVEPSKAFDLVDFATRFCAAQAILLDAWSDGFGGAGKTFDWSRIPTRDRYPLRPAAAGAPTRDAPPRLVLSGGLDASNVGEGIRTLRPRCSALAVDVSSGVEADAPGGGTTKGVKDAGKIHHFVAAVRAADAALAKDLHRDDDRSPPFLPA